MVLAQVLKAILGSTSRDANLGARARREAVFAVHGQDLQMEMCSLDG